MTLPPKDSIPEVAVFQDSVLSCNGDSVVLKASSNTVGLTWSWSWHHLNTNTDSLMFVPDHSQKVYVKACNNYGCSSQDSIYILFVAPPIFQYITPDTSICLNDSVSLQATGGRWIQWSDSAGTISTENNLKLKPVQTTLYSVKTWNQKGCVSSDLVKVVVNALPETRIIYDTNRVCRGNIIALKASGANSYTWFPKDTTASQIAVNVNDTLNICLTGISDLGCKASDSVELLPLPLPVTKIIYDSGEVCQGTWITLKASGADAYHWFPKDTTSLVLSFDLLKSTKIQLVGSNKEGCSAKDSLELIPFPLPKVDFSGLSSFYCMNELPVTLDGSPAGGVFSGVGMKGDVFLRPLPEKDFIILFTPLLPIMDVLQKAQKEH